MALLGTVDRKVGLKEAKGYYRNMYFYFIWSSTNLCKLTNTNKTVNYNQINAVRYSKDFHSTQPELVIHPGQEVMLRLVNYSEEEGICV